MQRVFKTRLYPNNKQLSFLNACANNSRAAYNKSLEIWNEQYEAGERPSGYSVKAELNAWKRTDEGSFLLQTPKSICDSATQDLERGFKQFFRGNGGHPRFHKKGHCRHSFRIDGGRVEVCGNRISLPNVKENKQPKRILSLKMGETFRYEGICTKIYNMTISQKAGMWFVSVCCEIPDSSKNQAGIVGIDMGMKELATLSDGQVVENPRVYKRRERRMNHLQRELARKKKGSKNREKARARLAKFQHKTACMRGDYIHKATSEIAGRYGTVVVEDLNISGMVKNHNLAKSIHDASMSEFVRQLSYKANVVKIDRWFPSSQLCSCCGHRKKMPLSVRTYECPECGLVLDRDLNAAINILYLGAASPEVMPVEGVEVPDWVFDWVAERPAKQESTGKPA